MKLILLSLLFLAACTTPLKPQPSGTKEIIGDLNGSPKYVITQIFEAPVCMLWYIHGLDEDENAVRSSKYPHDELVPMARKLGCNVAVPSYGKSWMLNADVKPMFGAPSPSMNQFLNAIEAIENKHGLPKRRYAEGISMGAFNLSTIALDQNGFFEKAIIIDPVMINKDVGLATLLVFANFKIQTWYGGASPNVKVMTKTAMTKSWFMASTNDEYVPFDGPSDFAKKALSRGMDLTYHISNQKHGHLDPVADQKPLMDWIVK